MCNMLKVLVMATSDGRLLVVVGNAIASGDGGRGYGREDNT